ncbi:MAG: LytTR family transcriptional regulator [Lachnospiraceae bacterium]|nr:LytTR family transcriptional regulator [Lachnospiraceae bacterium]
MKVRIEVDEDLQEESVVIHCRKLDERILQMQNALTESRDRTILLHKNDTDYYMQLDTILFFETEGKEVWAHTASEIYESDYRLCQLEELLPGYFMRISKSAIVNLKHIYSITRNLTASSRIEFSRTQKQVYVSRSYYKALVERLAEKRKRL